jgi:magnesium transporter
MLDFDMHPFRPPADENRTMNGKVLQTDCTVVDATTEIVEAALRAGTFFWLDLVYLDAEGSKLLTDAFKFHPLAVEDVEHFGQRPKIEEYEDFFYLVVHGAEPDGKGTEEVHFFYSAQNLVTIRRGECEAIETVRNQATQRHELSGSGKGQIMLLYRVIDALVDTFFPVLAHFDDKIDELEDAILVKPTDEQLGTLFEMKRDLVRLRKVVTPERDMFVGLVSGMAQLPGMTPDAERYFRDLYDHLIRVSDLVDSYRDLLSGAMDTHLSTVSNRLNGVMKQLTIIATVFLPLSFLTGFFGQNFGWMVNRIGSLGAFFGLAIGFEFATAAVLLVFFRRRGWIGGS